MVLFICEIAIDAHSHNNATTVAPQTISYLFKFDDELPPLDQLSIKPSIIHNLLPMVAFFDPAQFLDDWAQ